MQRTCLTELFASLLAQNAALSMLRLWLCIACSTPAAKLNAWPNYVRDLSAAQRVKAGVVRGICPAIHAAGPPDSEVTPPEKRKGKLWEFYREVTSQGWPVDCHSYTTNFRCAAA